MSFSDSTSDVFGATGKKKFGKFMFHELSTLKISLLSFDGGWGVGGDSIQIFKEFFFTQRGV